MEMINNFLYLLKEEWIYHIVNIVIIVVFALFGAYRSMKYKTKDENITFLTEFLKSFTVLMFLYCLYILYKMGYLVP